MRFLDEVLVVTTPNDLRTKKVVESVKNARWFETDAFYRWDAQFNKSLAIEEGFDELGREGFILIFDADTLFPDNLDLSGIQEGKIYSCPRVILEDAKSWTPEYDWSDGKIQHDIPCPGYFQLFHAGDPVIKELPWYDVRFVHAGGGDGYFQTRWADKDKVILPHKVLHLGPRDTNWFGRVSKRIDDKQIDGNPTARHNDMEAYLKFKGWCGRPASGKFFQECVDIPTNTELRIPKRIGFFWSGGPLSWARYMTVKSCRKLSPDWEVEFYVSKKSLNVKLWPGNQSADYLEYKGENYLDLLQELDIKVYEWEPEFNVSNRTPVQQADLFKAWFLYERGGIYSDLDILYVSSLNACTKQVEGMDLALCVHKDKIFTGFMGAAPQTDAARYILQNASACTGVEFGVVAESFFEDLLTIDLPVSRRDKRKVAKLSTKDLIGKLNDKFKNTVAGSWYNAIATPWTEDVATNIFEKNHQNLPTPSIGIHWLGSDVKSQFYNNILNHDTYYQYVSTFTNFARKVEEAPDVSYL